MRYMILRAVFLFVLLMLILAVASVVHGQNAKHHKRHRYRDEHIRYRFPALSELKARFRQMKDAHQQKVPVERFEEWNLKARYW